MTPKKKGTPRPRQTLFLGNVVLAAALMTSGASSQRDLAALRLAELHLSAITTVQRIMQFAYGVRPAAEHLFQPNASADVKYKSCPLSLADFNDPPASSFSFVQTDGSQVELYTWNDNSYAAAIAYTDGSCETIYSRAVEFFPGTDSGQTYKIDDCLSTGDSAHFVQHLDLWQPDPTKATVFTLATISVGEMVLADGTRSRFVLMHPNPQFRVERTDLLYLDLPGGEHLQWTVSIDENGPRFDRPACGTYSSQGQSIDFCLVRTSEKNYSWTISDDQGLNGQFTLNDDFSGQGRAMRGTRLEFVGKWSSQAVGTVLLADGRAAVAGPSAGALAFGRLRFNAFAVINGPAPGTAR